MSYNTWMPSYGQQGGGYGPAWQGQMQGYPQQMQSQPVAAQSPQQGFYVRPVTNREEAVAAQPQAPAPEYATKADLLEMREVVQGLAADIERMRQPVRGGKRLEPDE